MGNAAEEATSPAPWHGVLLRRVVIGFAPAAILVWLGVDDAVDALHGALLLAANPSWPIAVEVVREILYGAFVLAGAIVLWGRREPRFRDGRARVIIASLGASFLLVGVGLLPAGSVMWGVSVPAAELGLLITLVGAALAVVALASLGSNFSIVPEAQSLVVTGPYRSVRNPMYLAEILMMFGIVLGNPRICLFARGARSRQPPAVSNPRRGTSAIGHLSQRLRGVRCAYPLSTHSVRVVTARSLGHAWSRGVVVGQVGRTSQLNSAT